MTSSPRYQSSDDDLSDFDGFDRLDQNWFRFPNIVCDKILISLSRGEFVLLVYIIRHTIGFNDSLKRISLDEFENGRKRKDGSRLDTGTQLGRSTIIRSIKLLTEKRLIRRITDSSDLGRIKNFYAIRFKGDPEVSELDSQGSRNDTPHSSSDLIPQGSRNDTPEVTERHPVQRKTLERKTLKDKNVATPAEYATLSSGVVSSPTKQTKQPSKFDVKATQEFTAILDKVGVKYRTQDKTKWQHQFRLLREYDKASKDDIKAVIKWYANYYPDEKGQQYAIVCHSAKSFREKFFDKLLPRCQQSIPAKDAIVNRIRFLSLRDVQQAHRRDPEWGTNDFFRYTDDWKIGKYLADKEGHYREMAQIVNAARHDRPGEVRFILEAIGMYHLIVEDE